MVCSKRFSVSVHVCACGTVWVFECARVSVFVRFQSVCVFIVFELVCVYCVGFVTQYIYQTSPIFHQKSPIFHQKSPALHQKSLALHQKSPVFHQQSPIFCHKCVCTMSDL